MRPIGRCSSCTLGGELPIASSEPQGQKAILVAIDDLMPSYLRFRVPNRPLAVAPHDPVGRTSFGNGRIDLASPLDTAAPTVLGDARLDQKVPLGGVAELEARAVHLACGR